MLNNLFANAPTVGSHDNNFKTSSEECAARMQYLEQRVQNLEQQISNREQSRYEEGQTYEKPKRKGIRWGKINKFFTAVIKPILTFLPNFLFAVAGLKKATTSARA